MTHPAYYAGPEDFLRAIHADPHEWVNHGAFADWLDEQGQSEEAAFRRAVGEWMGQGDRRFPWNDQDLWGTDLRWTVPKGVDWRMIPQDFTGTGDPHHPTMLPEWDAENPNIPIGRRMAWLSYPHMEEAFRRAYTPPRKLDTGGLPTHAHGGMKLQDDDQEQFSAYAQTRYGGPYTHADFHHGITSTVRPEVFRNELDVAAQHAYADWLEEQGLGAHSEFLRHVLENPWTGGVRPVDRLTGTSFDAHMPPVGERPTIATGWEGNEGHWIDLGGQHPDRNGVRPVWSLGPFSEQQARDWYHRLTLEGADFGGHGEIPPDEYRPDVGWVHAQPPEPQQFAAYADYGAAEDEASFLDHIRRNPEDAVARGAYADWLEEAGHPDADLLGFLRSHRGRAWLHRGAEGLRAGPGFTWAELRALNGEEFEGPYKGRGGAPVRGFFQTHTDLGSEDDEDDPAYFLHGEPISGPGGTHFVVRDPHDTLTAAEIFPGPSYDVWHFDPGSGAVRRTTHSRITDPAEGERIARGLSYPENLSRYGATEDENAFRGQIRNDPLDLTNHRVFADFLTDTYGEEHPEPRFRRDLADLLEHRLNTLGPNPIPTEGWQNLMSEPPRGLSAVPEHLLWAGPGTISGVRPGRVGGRTSRWEWAPSGTFPGPQSRPPESEDLIEWLSGRGGMASGTRLTPAEQLAFDILPVEQTAPGERRHGLWGEVEQLLRNHWNRHGQRFEDDEAPEMYAIHPDFPDLELADDMDPDVIAEEMKRAGTSPGQNPLAPTKPQSPGTRPKTRAELTPPPYTTTPLPRATPVQPPADAATVPWARSAPAAPAKAAQTKQNKEHPYYVPDKWFWQEGWANDRANQALWRDTGARDWVHKTMGYPEKKDPLKELFGYADDTVPLNYAQYAEIYDPRSIIENPHDADFLATSADWFDENDAPEEAAFRRAAADWLKHERDIHPSARGRTDAFGGLIQPEPGFTLPAVWGSVREAGHLVPHQARNSQRWTWRTDFPSRRDVAHPDYPEDDGWDPVLDQTALADFLHTSPESSSFDKLSKWASGNSKRLLTPLAAHERARAGIDPVENLSPDDYGRLIELLRERYGHLGHFDSGDAPTEYDEGDGGGMGFHYPEPDFAHFADWLRNSGFDEFLRGGAPLYEGGEEPEMYGPSRYADTSWSNSGGNMRRKTLGQFLAGRYPDGPDAPTHYGDDDLDYAGGMDGLYPQTNYPPHHRPPVPYLPYH